MTRPVAPSPLATRDRIDGRLVYAVGDIHGRYDRLKELLNRLAGDVRDRAPRRKPVLIFCGDYIDRGPDTAQVLEALGWLQRDGRFEVRLLKGNHEDAFQGFMDSPDTRSRWLQVGGRATLISYGVSPPERPDDPDACRTAHQALCARMPAAHRALIDGLELMVTIGDYAFVHAGIRPERPLADQTPRDLMWIREGFLDRGERFEKRIVHGHSWTGTAPEIRDNRLGIDTGAFRTGVLTAVRITDGEVAFFQTAADDASTG